MRRWKSDTVRGAPSPSLVSLGFLLGILCLHQFGCATAEKEVQKVAKDWCMTIRGSQVIPVYPLTEDIQPGDIYLVQLPIDQQQKLYRERGFLALDNHLARLDPGGYVKFYDHSFLPKDFTNELPRAWIRPSGTNVSWHLAPHAAFPSYSFTVRNGAGINLAVPVNGVPVGLSLLASDAASGTIEIKNACTLGVDTISLYREVRGWAAENADFLRHFGTGATEKKINYLRVVTRIYATGRMGVTLKDASNRSGGLDVGVPKPVNLLMPELPASSTNTAEAALKNYSNAWSTLSQIVAAATTATNAAGQLLPGGSLRLTAASARTVSLDETFDPPVILGYLGFDCAIFKGGILGPPIPTHAVLDPGYRLGRLFDLSPVYAQMLNLTLYRILEADKANPKAQAVRSRLDALAAVVPDQVVEYNPTVAEPANFLLTATTVPLDRSLGYPAFHQFQTTLRNSIATLEAALALPGFRFKKDAGDPIAVTAGSPQHQELERTVVAYRNLYQRNAEDAAVQNALSDAHGYYLGQLAQ